MKTVSITLMLALLIAVLGAGAASAEPCCAAGATCAVAAPAGPDNTLTVDEQAAGFRLLFDGKTFDNWGCTDADQRGWTVDNGAMYYNVQGGGYMYTKDRFGNFELKIDFMVNPGTNSGVFFRWDKLGDPVQTGIEMQVLDSARAKRPGKHDCGAVYDVLAPSENAMRPALEWNQCIIKCRNSFITITLNGKRVIRMDVSKYTEAHKSIDGTRNKFGTAYAEMPREGHIGLQAHGGKVWYKNVKIRTLD